jgi:glycosyltransferase involved in cell wall biosynthesis
MARVAIEARVMQGGYPGIGRATAGLLEALLRQATGHRYLLVIDPRRPLPPELTVAQSAGHRLVPVPASLRGRANQMLLPLRLCQYRAALYHATYFGTAVALPVPLVLTVWDLIPERFPHYWKPLQALVIRRWLRWQAARAAAIIAPSQATQQDLITLYHLPAATVSVVPPGVPAAWGAVHRMPPSDPPFALCVCTNKPHKNLVRLVEGYAEACGGAPAFPALIIAGGWDPRYPQAKERAAALGVLHIGPAPRCGSVLFLHDMADHRLRELYAAALFFVFPSEYEGFGLPVLEAMLAGVPVAASSTTAVREVTGPAALAFDSHDSTSIALALQSMVRDAGMRSALAQQGALRAASFSAEETAARTLAVYDRVLGQTAVAPASEEG